MPIPTMRSDAAVTTGTATVASSAGWDDTADAASPQIGDYRLVLNVSTATSAMTPPSGWTNYASSVWATNNVMQIDGRSYPSAQGSQLWTWSTGGRTLATMIINMTSIDQNSALNVASTVATGTGSTATAASVTTTTANTLIIALFAVSTTASGTAPIIGTPSGSPSYDTGQATLVSGATAGGWQIRGGLYVQTAAGASGTRTATLSGATTGRQWAAFTLALNRTRTGLLYPM